MCQPRRKLQIAAIHEKRKINKKKKKKKNRLPELNVVFICLNGPNTDICGSVYEEN